MRKWSLLGRFASGRWLCSKDAFIETRTFTQDLYGVLSHCRRRQKRCRRWLLTRRRKQRWRRPRGGQRRTQASREEEHARWVGRSGAALQTNNLGRLNPVKRRTFASSFLTFFIIIQLRSFSPFLAASSSSTLIRPSLAYVLSRRSREESQRGKPEIVINYCAADMWRLVSCNWLPIPRRPGQVGREPRGTASRHKL